MLKELLRLKVGVLQESTRKYDTNKSATPTRKTTKAQKNAKRRCSKFVMIITDATPVKHHFRAMTFKTLHSQSTFLGVKISLKVVL